MKTKSKVSTKFISESNRHSIKTLVSIGTDKPPVRAPINVALVLDRSGSMDGEPLHEAKAAALKFVSYLSKDDRLSIVTFDSLVETAFGQRNARGCRGQHQQHLFPRYDESFWWLDEG